MFQLTTDNEARARCHDAASPACRPFDMISVASGAGSRAKTDIELAVDASAFICQLSPGKNGVAVRCVDDARIDLMMRTPR